MSGVSKMSNTNSMNAGGDGILFPADAAMDDELFGQARNGMPRFLAGGPMGPLSPLGMFPVDVYDEEEEDPNP